MKTINTIGKKLFPGLLLILAGCTSVPKDGGIEAVQQLVDAQIVQ